MPGNSAVHQRKFRGDKRVLLESKAPPPVIDDPKTVYLDSDSNSEQSRRAVFGSVHVFKIRILGALVALVVIGSFLDFNLLGFHPAKPKVIFSCSFASVGNLAYVPRMTMSQALDQLSKNSSRAVIIENFRSPRPPIKLQVRPMTREDGEPFFLEFNSLVDRMVLGSSSEYGYLTRIENVTGVVLLSEAALHDFVFEGVAVGCTSWPMEAPEGFLPGSCIMTRASQFQWRISNGDTIIHVIKGQLRVGLTVPAKVASLKLFPSLHPLRGQSRLSSFASPRHALFASHEGGDFAQCTFVTITASEALWIPPFWGHSIIAEERSVLTIFNSKEGQWLSLGSEIAQMIPRALRPGVLKDGVFFVRIWLLEIFIDELFGLRGPRNRKGSALEKIVRDRWRDAFSTGYIKTRSATLEELHVECLEIKSAQYPKEMQLQDRYVLLDDNLESVRSINNSLAPLASDLAQSVVTEMKLDLIDRIIGDILCARCAEAFFACYFDWEEF